PASRRCGTMPPANDRHCTRRRRAGPPPRSSTAFAIVFAFGPGSEQAARLGVVTGDGMSLPTVDEGRFLVDTALALGLAEILGELPAARAEPAARRRVDGVGDVAVQHDPLASPLHDRVGH